MASQNPLNSFENLFAGAEYNAALQTHTANSSSQRIRAPAEHLGLISLPDSVRERENLRRIYIFNHERVEEPTSNDPELEGATMAASGIISADYLGLEGDIGCCFVENANIDVDNAPVLLESQIRVLPDGSPATFLRQPQALNTEMLSPAVFRAIKVQYENRTRHIEADYMNRLEQLNGPRRAQKLRLIVRNDLNHAINVELKSALVASQTWLLAKYLGLLRGAQLSFVTNIVCQNCQRHHYDHNSLQQWEMLKNAWSVSQTDVGDDFGVVEVYANPIMIARCKKDLENLAELYFSAVSGTKCRPAEAGKGYYLL